MKETFKTHWKLYLMEAFGLAIFMISACFFGAMLEAKNAFLHQAIPNGFMRLVLMGIFMGLTALLIFYSPLTAPSGSHINPAVTLTFFRLKMIGKWCALFYIIFQFIGGAVAVYVMASLMGNYLTDLPVQYVVTIPGKGGSLAALLVETVIAFIMMTMVLFTSSNNKTNKFTRPIAGLLVCMYVIIAGPISGFGMNPARTLASAIPAHNYTALWIYMIAPIVGMMSAAEFFLFYKRQSASGHEIFSKKHFTLYKQKHLV